MDFALFTTSMPPWLLFGATFAIGIIVAELGAKVAQAREKKIAQEKLTPVGSLVGATLGLLAFMLGFTFSITASRYNERKHLMVEQARAIGTCFLRTSFLPDNQKRETRMLVSRYMDILVGVTTAEDIHDRLARMEEIETDIWRQAASLKDETMDSPLRSLYVASVNEMLDSFAERKAVVLTYRIPGAIWLVLLLLYLLNMFLVGSENSGSKSRRRFNVPIMTAGFALIVMLIAAMDASTKRGHFTVDRQPLLDVQRMINEENRTIIPVR
jgi:hypothetical protein